MSTLLLAAADGNQVSCLIEALSDVLFVPSRDSKAPWPYSRSHAYLKKTIWNITIWCRDSCAILRSDFTLFWTQEKYLKGSDITQWGLGGETLFAVINYKYDPEHQTGIFFPSCFPTDRK